MKHGLLIGIRTEDLGALARSLQADQVAIHVAIGFRAVTRLCDRHAFDFAFVGCELEPAFKLKTVAHILAASPSTQIHVMGRNSNVVRFVAGIVRRD